MKLLLMNLVLAMVCPPLSAKPVPRNGDQEDAAGVVVRKSEAALWRAYSIHDVPGLNFLLTDDLTFTKENGYCTTKEQELRTQEKLSGGSPGDEMEYKVEKVRVIGAAAITNGYFIEEDENGKPFRFHFTNTWVQRNGHWQVAAIQITQVSAAVLAKVAGK